MSQQSEASEETLPLSPDCVQRKPNEGIQIKVITQDFET